MDNVNMLNFMGQDEIRPIEVYQDPFLGLNGSMGSSGPSSELKTFY